MFALLLCSFGVASGHTPRPLLIARAPTTTEPTPAVKLLDVVSSTARESMTLLLFLRGAALVIDRSSPKLRGALTILAWIIVVQGSSRLQGVMQKPTETLSPEWYNKLRKPSWQPPPWAFPLAWIPLKLAQTAAATILWQGSGLEVFSSPAVIMYVIHIALGDVWNAQFFLKQRLLTGLLVIGTFWAVLVGATVAFFQRDPLAGALLAPTVAWVSVAASLNVRAHPHSSMPCSAFLPLCGALW